MSMQTIEFDECIKILWMGGTPSEHSRNASIPNIINDPKYGGTVQLSPHTATVYQILQLQEKSIAALLELISRRKALLHQHLLTLRNHFFKHDKNGSTIASSLSCGSESKIEIYLEYPYHTRSLEDVIEQHSLRGEYVPEKQVVRIFGAVVGVLDFLAKNGTCHGDVKSSNIIFDHNNTSKLMDSYFINGGKTAYQIVLENPSSMSLLAPEQMDRIKHRQFENISTIHNSQVFMVGLTMLETMTLESAMEAYDLEALQMVEGYIQRKEEELRRSKYSGPLCQMVLSCLQPQMKKRPSFSHIMGELRSLQRG